VHPKKSKDARHGKRGEVEQKIYTSRRLEGYRGTLH